MTATLRQLAALREAYLRGDSIKEAAAHADVSVQTAWRKFKRFVHEGLMRPPRLRARSRYYSPRGIPRYTGPVMIGNAITTPPAPVGPDWIGVAINR